MLAENLASQAAQVTTSKAGRLIVDKPASGPWNMAVDAAILEHVAKNDPPTLRFYRWEKPTLSLGYFQSIADRALHEASSEIDLVRRTTGGGAIVHDRELTYSIIIPQTNRSHGADSPLYQAVHQAIISALQTVGISAMRFGNSSTHTGSHEPFLCFQRRTTEDLVVSGYKVLGSAQRRGGSGILQHGSLLLASSAVAPELPGLWNLKAADAPANRELRRSEELDAFANQLIQHISAELGRAWDMRWASGQLSTEERKSALKIRENRFTAPSWNFKR